MRRLLASFIVMFCLVSFTVGPVAATDPGLPNHPKLYNPNEVRILAMGLPQGTRVWMDVNIPNGNGGIMALCLKYLIAQPIFPAAGPARGGSMFCLANLMVETPFQSKADVHIFNRSTGGSMPHSFVCNDALILIGNTTGTTTMPRTLTITCNGNGQGLRLFAHLVGGGQIRLGDLAVVTTLAFVSPCDSYDICHLFHMPEESRRDAS